LCHIIVFVLSNSISFDKMIRKYLVIYILSAIVLTTAVLYFILAYNEYTSLIEIAAEGLDGEISELQIEIALFAGSGIIYVGLVGWILVKKLKSIVLYSILIITSKILIITYTSSRTIGIPIIGVEYYIGKYYITTKVLHGIIIATSGYLIYRKITLNKYRTQEKNLISKFKQIIIFLNNN
ncbi:MAG TPA: hypothetical protein VFV86_02830, partial [Nitrososphaeraceae archaeon]|nr:hypothetical protein [Nitrososphaeraceae archaeon]